MSFFYIYIKKHKFLSSIYSVCVFVRSNVPTAPAVLGTFLYSFLGQLSQSKNGVIMAQMVPPQSDTRYLSVCVLTHLYRPESGIKFIHDIKEKIINSSDDNSWISKV